MAVVAVAGRTPVYELTAADLVVRRRAASTPILGVIVLLAALQHSRCITTADASPQQMHHHSRCITMRVGQAALTLGPR